MFVEAKSLIFAFWESSTFCILLTSTNSAQKLLLRCLSCLVTTKKRRLLQWSELLGKYIGSYFSSWETNQTKAAQKVSIYEARHQKEISSPWTKAVSVKYVITGDVKWTVHSILYFVWKPRMPATKSLSEFEIPEEHVEKKW